MSKLGNQMISLYFLVIFLLHSIECSFAFQQPRIVSRYHDVTSRTTQHIFSSKIAEQNDDNDTNNGKKSSMMTLKFVGETVITSDVAANSDDSKPLREFFSQSYAAPIILQGSKDNHVNEIENIDDELFNQYKQNCELTGASTPTNNNRIFDVTTSGISFPGLQVMSVVTIGVQIVSTKQDLPGYELVLIRDATYAKGNRLFVWFFNKVTGKDKSTKSEQATFSFNKISVVPKENDMIAFESNANLSLFIKFPALLMKAIPGASKEKFEKTGGESLVKALEDDLPTALENFRREYMKWLES